MQIRYSPLRPTPGGLTFKYIFGADIVVAQLWLGEAMLGEDIFNFSDLPEGELLAEVGEDGHLLPTIETTLPQCPVTAASRQEGVLHLTLLYYHAAGVPAAELWPLTEYREV